MLPTWDRGGHYLLFPVHSDLLNVGVDDVHNAGNVIIQNGIIAVFGSRESPFQTYRRNRAQLGRDWYIP